MTWAELLERWKAEQYALIDAAVERQDALLAAEGASDAERARLGSALRATLVGKTDLEIADVLVDWAEKSARLRAEGLARTEEACRRDGLGVLETEFVVAQAEIALDAKIDEGFEMIRASRARALDPPLH